MKQEIRKTMMKYMGWKGREGMTKAIEMACKTAQIAISLSDILILYIFTVSDKGFYQ
jgi:hypothetical protein